MAGAIFDHEGLAEWKQGMSCKKLLKCVPGCKFVVFNVFQQMAPLSHLSSADQKCAAHQNFVQDIFLLVQHITEKCAKLCWLLDIYMTALIKNELLFEHLVDIFFHENIRYTKHKLAHQHQIKYIF